MLGMSMTELVIILALALLLLGPDQLPSLAKSLGKGLRELRKATDDLKSTFEQEMASVDLNQPPPRIAAAPKPTETTSSLPSAPPADPGEARAAARMAAAKQQEAAADVAAAAAVGAGASEPAAPEPKPELRLVAPEGTVARQEKKP